MATTKKVKQYRLHYEGTPTLIITTLITTAVVLLAWWTLADVCLPGFIAVALIFGVLYGIIVNFFRCPIRTFPGAANGNIIVAPADGHVVVIEEVDENEYFHDRRLMVSIFMSVTNVHANWFPVSGLITLVRHHNGRFMKAWLPKASIDNERSTIVIRTASGHEVLVRQVAGAVARRIVTYATEGQECYIDNHMGFIKFGSRVDLYLPLGTPLNVTMGQATIGDQTVIGTLEPLNP